MQPLDHDVSSEVSLPQSLTLRASQLHYDISRETSPVLQMRLGLVLRPIDDADMSALVTCASVTRLSDFVDQNNKLGIQFAFVDQYIVHY